MKRCWRRVAFPLVLLVAGARAADGADNGGNVPFLARVYETNGTAYRIGNETRFHLPTDQRLEFVYADLPYCVQVPIPIRQKDGIVRIAFSVRNLGSSLPCGFEKDFTATDFGLYKVGGKSGRLDVLYDWNGGGYLREHWRPLPFVTNGPIGSWCQAELAGPPRDIVMYAGKERGEHVPFTRQDKDGQRTTVANAPSFILAPPEPGTYVLWFAFDHFNDWPEAEVDREEVRFKLLVDLIVSRGEYTLGGNEIDFLYGRGPLPVNMPPSNQFERLSYEIPVTLRRQAWIFDRATIEAVEGAIARERFEWRGYDIEFKPSRVEGPVTTIGYEALVRERGPSGGGNGRLLAREKTSWVVAWPGRIPDYGFAEMTIGGGVTLLDRASDMSTNYCTFGWLPRSEVDVEPGPPLVAPRFGIYSRISPETFSGPDRASAEATELSRFLYAAGDLAKPHWNPDYRPRSIFDGPAPGSPPFRYLVSARPPYLHERKFVKGDGGPYPVIVWTLGPWRTYGYYRRQKDVDSRYVNGKPYDPTPAEAPQEDPFWAEWEPAFQKKLNGWKLEIDSARTDAAMCGIVLQSLRRSQRIIRDGIKEDPSSRWSQIWDDLVRSGSRDAGETPAQMRARMQAQLKAQEALIQESLQGIEQAGAKARSVLGAQLEELKAGYGRFETHRDEIANWRKEFQDQLERVPLEMAVLSGDYEAFQAAEDKLGVDRASADTRVFEAQLQIDRGRAIEALDSLYSACRVDPGHAVAKRMLAELEASFLKTAMEKACNEIGRAREYFYDYIRQRGYDAKDPGKGWLGQRWAPLRDIDGEMAWASFTTGLLGTFTGLLDKPAQVERGAGADADAMTTAYLGLQVILRLRLRGYTLAAIRDMRTHEILEALPVRDPQGNPYGEAHARRFGVAIQQAMKLPDVRALTDRNLLDLKFSTLKTYGTPQAVCDTMTELVGDITSPKNLIMFLLPSSVGSVGGRLVGVSAWGAREVQAVQLARSMGAVRSGTEVFAAAVAWDRAMRVFGERSIGRFLLRKLEQLHGFEESLSGAGRASWMTGKMVAFFVLQGYSLKAVEETGGPQAVMFVEALLLLAGDQAALRKWLAGNRLDPKRVADAVRKQYLVRAREAQEKIEKSLAQKQRIRKLVEFRLAGNTLSPEESRELAAALDRNWRRRVPNGEPSNDLAITVDAAGEAALGPEPAKGRSVLKAADDLTPKAKEQSENLSKKIRSAEKLADGLEGMNVTMGGSGPYKGPPVPKWFNQESKYLTPLSHRSRYPKVRAANEALFNGDVVEARRLYEQALSEMTSGGPEYEMAQRRLALACEILDTPRSPRPEGFWEEGLSFDRAADRAVVDNILHNPQKWKLYHKSGTVSAMYEMDGHLIKQVEVGSFGVPPQEVTSESLERFMESEVVNTALARELGFDVPDVAHRLIRNESGKAVRLDFVYRKIPGMALEDLSPAAIFQYRRELSELRAFAEFVGDYDRHAGNFLVSNGRVVGIDWGLGDPRGIRARDWTALGRPDDDPFAIAFFEGKKGGRDHTYFDRKLKAGPGNSIDGKEVGFVVAEEVLTYNAAAPAMKKIQDLLKDRSRLERTLTESYRKIHGPNSDVSRYVREAVENLEWRGKHLDRTMKGFNERNWIPLPGEREPPPIRESVRGRPWKPIRDLCAGWTRGIVALDSAA